MTHYQNLRTLLWGLAWSLGVLVIYALLRGYYDMHLFAVVVGVRLAVGIAIGASAGVGIVLARFMRVPGPRVSPVKGMVYVGVATIAGLATYNLVELWVWG